MKKSVILLILLSCFQYALSQGLQFHGNENDIDERSSLAIPAELSDARSVEAYQLEFTAAPLTPLTLPTSDHV